MNAPSVNNAKRSFWYGHYLKRRRDGVWYPVTPDNGWWHMSETPKTVCVPCRKVWRGAIERNGGWRHHRKPPTVCPHCGSETREVNASVRVPRSANKRAWRKKFGNER